MDAKILNLAEAPPRPTVTSADQEAITSVPAGGAATPLRWRFTLESMWERKLGEVVALAGACHGVSAAGDDLPGDGAALPSFRLYCRAAGAYEDLAAIADAIGRVDAGTFGQCEGCARPMDAEWLARDPLMQYCRACLIAALAGRGSWRPRTSSRHSALAGHRGE